MAPSANMQEFILESIEVPNNLDPKRHMNESVQIPSSIILKAKSSTGARRNPAFAIDPTRDAGRDAWRNEPNPRERKRIQDRLAQRARRKRLAELKQKSSRENESSSEQDSDPERQSTGQGALTLLQTSSAEQSIFETMTLVEGLALPEFCPIPLISNDHRALRVSQFSICAALYMNGLILGLTCSHIEATVSKPPQPTTPLALQPTALQLQTEHIPWLDRFPFPSMRDNAIVLTNSKVIDPHAFLVDLFLMHSFELRDGGVSWDPKAWRIGPEFGAKWGWLFC